MNIVGPLLAEQKRSIGVQFTTINTQYPDNDKLVTQHVGRLVVMLLHTKAILASMSESLDYIENMLCVDL